MKQRLLLRLITTEVCSTLTPCAAIYAIYLLSHLIFVKAFALYIKRYNEWL